jgi:2-aminoethylphosphonate dioxygenase
MLATPTLTEAQIRSFHDCGYVFVPGAFSPGEARLMDGWAKDLAARPEQVGSHWVYHELSLKGDGERLINRIENMTPFHEGCRELCDVLRPSVGQLLGEPAVLFKDKINYKMPGGEGFKPHQDAQAGWETYARYYINVMVSIDEATTENGCLEVARRPAAKLVGNEWEPLTVEQTERMDFKLLPTKPGDILYFDAYVPHRSEPNMSDKIRRMYFLTYNRLSEGDFLERYYADKRASYPPDIERIAGKEYVYRV